jgi:TusA-related sulfurtransferase
MATQYSDTLASKTTGGVIMAQNSEIPRADDVLDATGATCATITPMTKAKISELMSGAILEVRSDDPAAREGMPAWSRLTGNDLLAVVVDDAIRTRFYLRKK